LYLSLYVAQEHKFWLESFRTNMLPTKHDSEEEEEEEEEEMLSRK
jgi:hypothetical protein